MLLLVAAALQPQPHPPVVRQATASVRIERPAKVSRDEWERVPQRQRREILVRDEAGRPLLLRLIENE